MCNDATNQNHYQLLVALVLGELHAGNIITINPLAPINIHILLIFSLCCYLGEFNEKSRNLIIDDYFLHSHDMYVRTLASCNTVMRRNYMLVTIGAERVSGRAKRI